MRQATWQDMWRGAEPSPEGEKKRISLQRLTLLSWEEWVTLVIVVVGFLSVAQSLDNANWVNEMPSLYLIGFLGIVTGLILAKTPAPELVAHLVALAAGVVGTAIASSAHLEGSIKDRVWELGDRLYLWADAVYTGGISNDNLPFVVIVVGLTFITAYVSVWSIFRWFNPWVGLIPGGLALLTNISYLPGQRSFNLLIYLFCSMLLVSRMHVLRNARAWRRDRTSYPDLLSLSVLTVTVWVAVGLLTVAWILPVGSGSGFFYKAWTSVTAPIAGPFQEVGRLFSSIDSKKGVSIHKFGSTLPLQGKISLSGGTEVEVEATEPGLLLRAQTYDFYTPAGWKISSASQITSSAWPALKPLQNPDELRKEFRRPISIDVTTVAKQSVILSASQPVSVDVDARVVFGPDASDITSIRPSATLKEGTQYQVDSSITQASPTRLRQSGVAYPAWITPYLQLPDTLPPTVKAKAQELTVGLDNPYDRANALEKYLRTFAVDTNISAAPPKKDSVAHFLFTTQKGYFDYHASAMVVMLRTLGIPARLTVGYIVRPIDRKADTNTYTISGANSFAWPEVYFPSLGWIEFNPTPSEPSIARPDSDDSSILTSPLDTSQDPFIDPFLEEGALIPADTTIDALTGTGGSNTVGTVLMIIVLGFFAISTIGFGAFKLVWERGMAGLDYPSQVWEKTLRLARWARLPLAPQQTPAEYVARLRREIPDAGDIDFLGTAYVRSRYGHKELEEPDKERLALAWKGVRKNLLSRLMRWR